MMLENIELPENIKLDPKACDTGHVWEFDFEDKTWTVCKMVVKAGRWVTDQKILLPENFRWGNCADFIGSMNSA